MSSRDRPPAYDRDEALVQRRVFADREIHRAELATMFDRAWLCIGPADWLARPHAYLTGLMGDQPVIAWRGADGRLRMFFNRCAWGEGPVAAQVRGEAAMLACACHGRPYAAEGGALEPVAKVAVHRGLVFANRDPDAPPFEDWLGDFAWYLDLFLPAGGVEAVGGDALRWTIEANWKLPVLAGCGEAVGGEAPSPTGSEGFQISLAGGAVTVRRTDQGVDDDPRGGFAPLGAILFPNLLFDRDRHSLEIVHPIGPTRCEVHSYCIVDRDAPAGDRDGARRRFQFLTGPAGLESGRLAQLWQSITAAARSGRHRDQGLSLRMGLGQERPSNLPGAFAPLVSEANQRAFFGWWQTEVARTAREVRRLMRLR